MFDSDRVDAMVAGTGSGGGEASILIGRAKVCHEIDQSFGGLLWFGAPIATRDFEEAGGVDNVVAEADDGGCRWDIISGCGEADNIIEFGEKFVDGCGWMPWRGHAEGVGIEFGLGDGAPGCPKMGEDLETGDASKAEFGIGEFAEVVGGDGEEDLVAESFVSLLVGAEGELIFVEDTVDFRNLWGGCVSRMDRVDGAVDGGNEFEPVGDEEVGFGRKGESEMTVDAVAGVGRDSGGVRVELSLGGAYGGISGGRGDGGDGGEDRIGKGGRDRGGGEGGGFLHGR